MKLHPSITPERVIDMCKRRNTLLDNPGICNACGEDADDCEPDARYYKCDACGKRQVFGEETYLHLVTT